MALIAKVGMPRIDMAAIFIVIEADAPKKNHPLGWGRETQIGQKRRVWGRASGQAGGAETPPPMYDHIKFKPLSGCGAGAGSGFC